MKEFYQKLSALQAELKAPKGQENKFGGYRYRSCEDILEAVKPLLLQYGFFIKISDEVIAVGDRFYVKATARISDGENFEETTALARETALKKGMDEAQITGSASSYARKYALNGLLAIDDTRDADATNDHGKGSKNEASKPISKPARKPAQTEAEKFAQDIDNEAHIMAVTGEEPAPFKVRSWDRRKIETLAEKQGISKEKITARINQMQSQEEVKQAIAKLEASNA